ncbi:hypothetical protein U472_07745 [Orenia metallireducens]|jgi:uncharacterized protein involved in exopolysaccharide biosynthesis|uniref:Polysaccharide chain length determinant N-terminal domain-containing protein n=1 Tax=Orenia metallireducens TaxID=1413210 RepID=A0A1C0AAQ2_9FIRM|nr:Wzz/FepE/Etk N-terminal domain-containing protein [Orenia metallireducens]OCL27343.1 hypothetical protein U472_07745 [Orenia metallireducens]
MENRNHVVEYEEIDLREYLSIMIKRKNLIIGILIFGILSGMILNLLLKPVYQSEAVIKLSNSSAQYSNINYAKQKIKSLDYMKEINNKFELGYDLNKLNKFKEENLEINEIEDTLLAISFKSNDPKRSELILSGLLTLFKEDSSRKFKVAQQERLDYLAAINAEISEINQELQENNEEIREVEDMGLSVGDKVIIGSNINDRLRNIREINVSLINRKQDIIRQLNNMEELEVINFPIVPETPIKPNKLLNLAISTMLGLFIGIFIAFFLEFLEE